MTMKNGYVFRDTFNNSVISLHRTESGAVKSAIRWAKSFSGNNSQSSYLPTELVRVQDGEEVARLQYEADDDGQGYDCEEFVL